MQSLLAHDVNILFTAMFLNCLPKTMCTTLADRGELLPCEVAAAADLLQHTVPLPVAAVEPAAVPSPSASFQICQLLVWFKPLGSGPPLCLQFHTTANHLHYISVTAL
jgi:hypothetical protein